MNTLVCANRVKKCAGITFLVVVAAESRCYIVLTPMEHHIEDYPEEHILILRGANRRFIEGITEGEQNHCNE